MFMFLAMNIVIMFYAIKVGVGVGLGQHGFKLQSTFVPTAIQGEVI